MRFTDKQLDSLDRQGQITALEYAKSVVVVGLEQRYQELNRVNQ